MSKQRKQNLGGRPRILEDPVQLSLNLERKDRARLRIAAAELDTRPCDLARRWIKQNLKAHEESEGE